MSHPELDPLDSDLADLFAAERSRPAPPSDARARVLAQVTATLGPGGGSGGGGRGAPPAVPPAGAALLKPILIGLALGGALVATVAVRDGASPVHAPPPLVTALAPDPAAAPAPAPEAPVLPASAAPPHPSAEASAPAHRDDSLTAERSILDEANRALGAGRSAAAFEALGRHAETFPRGRLSEEREGLWLRALISAGRLDEARARAARFKRLYPHSMLLPALDAALGTIP